MLWSSFNCASRNMSISVTNANRRLSSNHGNFVFSGFSSLILRVCSHSAKKFSHQRLTRARIGQHARNLFFEHRRLLQFPADREIEKGVVGDAAPQGERQARSQLDIGNTIDCAGSRSRWIGLDAEQKIGPDQHAFERGANPLIEISVCARALVKAE